MMDNIGLILLPHQNGDCRLVSKGLEITPGLSFQEWENIGLTLQFLAKSVQFAIGDWINYGTHTYGEMYAQAQVLTEKDYQTLTNYAYVCRQVPIYRRRDELTYSHHAEISSMSEDKQEEYLGIAARDNLSVRQLRQHVRDDQNGGTETTANNHCPNCGHKW